MQQQELMNKLSQIEEHAQSALADFPALAKERLRMICVLARFLKTEIQHARVPAAGEGRPALRTSRTHAASATPGSRPVGMSVANQPISHARLSGADAASGGGDLRRF